MHTSIRGKSIERGGGDFLADLRARAEIEALSQRYALGSDAIGRGDVDEGRRLYRSIFTEDAVIGASYPGNDPRGAPDLVATGPDGWVDVVERVFITQGYTASQHMIGNILIDVHGDRATMRTLLSATYVLDPGRSLDVGHGTYMDEVVRTRAGWRVARSTLQLISYVRLESPFGPSSVRHMP